MNHTLGRWWLHAKLVLLAVLKPLGIWGVAALAALDSSSIAIPMDIIVAGYIWTDRSRFWVYAILVGLGSALGALVPFFAGRAGGELFLLRRVDRAKFDQLHSRFARQSFWAVLIPAFLPPPTPFKLFAFGAGVFEMGVLPYMAAVFCGRTLHYLVLGVLTVRYGPQIVTLVTQQSRLHGLGLLLGFLLLLAAAVFFGWRKWTHRPSAAL